MNKRDQTLTIVAAAIIVLRKWSEIPISRAACTFRPELDWAVESSRLIAEREFENTLRMSPRSYEKLVTHLLSIDRKMSILRKGTEPMSPHNQHQLTIAYLSGGCMLHLRRLIGASRRHFYNIVYRVMEATVKVDSLKIEGLFPKTRSDQYTAAELFKQDSEHSVLPGVLARSMAGCASSTNPG